MAFYYKVPAVIEYEPLGTEEMDEEAKRAIEGGRVTEVPLSNRIAQVRPDLPPDVGAYACRRVDENTFLVKTEKPVKRDTQKSPGKIQEATTAEMDKTRAKSWHVPGVRRRGKNISRRV